MKTTHLSLILTVLIAFAGAQNASAQATWARNFGGGSFDYPYEGQTTSDGGFIVAGETESFGGGSVDAWILKTDSSGNAQWQKAYGTINNESVSSIHPTSDGGYVAAGYAGNPNRDLWILRLDSAGNVDWQKKYDGGNDDYAAKVRQTTDGGFIVAGNTSSFGSGAQDVVILKLNSFGNVQWQKAYGGMWHDHVSSIQQTSDGGYLFTGSFRSGSSATTADMWIVKLDTVGNVQWQKTLGTNDFDSTTSVLQTVDGGYMLEGYLGALADAVIVKLDASGNVQWQKSYSGSGQDIAASIQQNSTGSYIVAGYTNSFGAGGADFWILNLDNSGNILWQKTYGGTGADAAFSVNTTNDGGFIVVGPTESYGQNLDAWLLKLDAIGQISDDCPLSTDTSATAMPVSLTQSIPPALVNPATVLVADTSVTPTDSFASSQEQCAGSTCLYCDDFGDGILNSNWSYLKPAWSESGGNLIATPTRKAVAVAAPAFSGCSNCSFESSMSTAGGLANKVWMLGWYTDKDNTLEVLMKEENDKFVMKHRVGGSIAAKTKGVISILPNVSYTVKVTFDGTTFVLFVNGNQLATLPASSAANGTIGFQAKNTTATFSHVLVE